MRPTCASGSRTFSIWSCRDRSAGAGAGVGPDSGGVWGRAGSSWHRGAIHGPRGSRTGVVAAAQQGQGRGMHSRARAAGHAQQGARSRTCTAGRAQQGVHSRARTSPNSSPIRFRLATTALAVPLVSTLVRWWLSATCGTGAGRRASRAAHLRSRPRSAPVAARPCCARLSCARLSCARPRGRLSLHPRSP